MKYEYIKLDSLRITINNEEMILKHKDIVETDEQLDENYFKKIENNKTIKINKKER